jgi:hypothetical protein
LAGCPPCIEFLESLKRTIRLYDQTPISLRAAKIPRGGQFPAPLQN